MNEQIRFLVAYHQILKAAGIGKIRIAPDPLFPRLAITIKRPNGQLLVHYIQENILRQATAEQGEEAARAVLKELGWPEK